MSIAFNPSVTTNAGGTFNVTTEGYIQGTALNDPAIRNQLAGGILASSETLPMWGGVGISENVPTPGTNGSPLASLGPTLVRASQIAVSGSPAAGDLTGFSVFDQDHSMVTTPQSPVPSAGNGMGVNFYRLGSGARIAVAIDPALVDLEGNIITQLVSWDFVNQRLVPYEAAEAQIAITSQTWAGGVVTVVTTTAHNLAVGDDANISGAVPAGYNGSVTVVSTADNTHFTYALAAEPGGVSPATTPGVILKGGGALPVRIMDVNIGGSMTVVYSATTGFVTWNRSGSTAIILI
jgi:hypothetical protein